MRVNAMRLAVGLACLFLLNPTAARAFSVGVPFDAVGGTQVGTVDGDGTIEFYIPFVNGTSSTYGVGGGGLSSTSCGSWSCGTGTLTMYLMFSNVSPGSNLVTLEFDDLDIDGANDTANFLESVEFFDASSIITSLALIENVGDDEVAFADNNTQILEIGVNSSSTTFWAKLIFTAILSPKHGYYYWNTPETLLATISPVPLPAALPLFGSGLGIMGWFGWKRRRRLAKAA